MALEPKRKHICMPHSGRVMCQQNVKFDCKKYYKNTLNGLMVDMVVTRSGFSNRKSISLNNFLRRLDLGLLVGLEASRPT